MLGPILNSLNYNIIRTVWLTVRRMANLILELKGMRMLWSLQKKLFYLICCINKYFQLHLTVNGYDWFGILKMFVCNLFDNNYCLIYQDQFKKESLQLHTSNNLLFLISWRLFSNQLWVVIVDADIWIPKSSLMMWSC